MAIADRLSAEAEDILDIMQHQEISGARTVYTDTVQCGFATHDRCGLVNWMILVAQELQVLPETLHLAVDLTDRLLSVAPVQWGQQHLAGAACLWIASKYEEVHPAVAADICHVMRNSHPISELVAMEASILSTLDFRIARPTAWTFHGFFMQSADPGKADQQLRHLAQYLLELSLLDPDFIDLRPSARAAASVYLARKMLDYPQVWDEGLVGCSRFQAQGIQPFAAQLAYTHMCVTRDSIYTASTKLYSDSNKQYVGTMPACYELAIQHLEHTCREQYGQYKQQYIPQPAPQPVLQYKPAWMTSYGSWGTAGAIAGPAPVPAAAPSTYAPPYVPSWMSSHTASTAAGPVASSAFAITKAAAPNYAPYAPPNSRVCYCHWCLHYGQCSCWHHAATPPQVPRSMSNYYQWQQQQPSYGWTWQPVTA